MANLLGESWCWFREHCSRFCDLAALGRQCQEHCSRFLAVLTPSEPRRCTERVESRDLPSRSGYITPALVGTPSCPVTEVGHARHVLLSRTAPGLPGPRRSV